MIERDRIVGMYIMPQTKEEIAEYHRSYKLENHEHLTIKQWRYQGHFIPENTEHDAYVRFRDTTHCDFCNWKLRSGGKTRSNTKVRHHDHDIEGEDNFIGIICNICNIRERCTNTSGEPNIFYSKRTGKWVFEIMCCGIKHTKNIFKTFEEALTYKGEWYSLNSPNVFHDPAWEMVLP